MANDPKDQQEPEAPEADAKDAAAPAGGTLLAGAGAVGTGAVVAGPAGSGDGDAPLGPAQLGVTRYVLTAFLAVGVTVAYVAGKMLESIWNSLASWSTATRHASWLVRYREDERPGFTMVAGALIGIAFGVWLYKKPGVRQWADEVAGELAKVHWPNRELVQNGTVVVVVTGLFATIYVGLLDRLWVFVTTLVYGA